MLSRGGVAGSSSSSMSMSTLCGEEGRMVGVAARGVASAPPGGGGGEQALHQHLLQHAILNAETYTWWGLCRAKG
jgi:hypothetical protein